MPNTYTQLYIQIVFAVKGRQNFIKESFRVELQKYISGIIAAKNQKLYAIYCMPDHTHIFMSMNPDITISKLTGEIKSNSSSFIKDKKFAGDFPGKPALAHFLIPNPNQKKVVDYILNQPEHHKKKTFKQEYLQILEKLQIDYDNKYLFEFYD